MLKKSRFWLICAIFFLICVISVSAQESFTITTYYPSPYWSYNELTTTGNTYLATSSGNVGIGTTGPGAKLEIGGQIKITGGTPGANKVLTSDTSGLASWQTIGDKNCYWTDTCGDNDPVTCSCPVSYYVKAVECLATGADGTCDAIKVRCCQF